MKEIITISQETIQNKIYVIRGEKVMFDKDLANLYGVKTKALNQSIKRNSKRFPSDFMFELTKEEMEKWRSQIIVSKGIESLRSQIVTSNRGGRRYNAYVFTEQGVAMLSSVLNSERAILVNIQIIRAFTQLRKILATHKELREKIESMERKYDKRFRVIFENIKLMIKDDRKPKVKIGFREKKDKI